MLNPRRVRPSPRPSIQEVHLPAPLGGLNTLNGGTAMPVSDCTQLYNMVAAEYGLRARLGYREWCTGLTGAGDNYVRSVLPFTGSAANGANDRIFVTTSTGIWDVSSSGATTTARPFSPEATYAVGDAVTASGTTFICTVAGDSEDSVNLPSVWLPTTVYTPGSSVINDGSVYGSPTGGTSGVTGPTGTGVQATDGTIPDWIYICSSQAIVDYTVTWRHFPGNIAPTQVFAFGSSAGRAGHGVCHVQVTAAGHFLMYWDEANGLHVYTESTDTWDNVAEGIGGTQISGVNPENLVFGTVFKGRVFHIEANTAKIWYSAAGSIYGALSALNLGFKLKAGGPLVGCWSWTYDGGSGIDDALVVASTGGDICVFKGTDPASANAFGMDGVYGVGALPAGRDLATDFGGDLLIATRSGIVPMSRLVIGQMPGEAQYQTAKIANLFNAAMLSKATTPGWTMRLHPEESALIVTVPEAEGVATTQLAMSLNTKSWSQLRDLPIYSSGIWGGKFYFGTVDGKVCINDGYKDNITLADPTSWTAVQYAGLSSFQNLGSIRRKQIQVIRGTFLGESTTPSYKMAARYDFDMTDLATVAPGVGGGNTWDSAVWDTATWGGQFAPSTSARGACGHGVSAAISWRGAASGRTILVGFDVAYTSGGIL
jgi:hypothetical protein